MHNRHRNGRSGSSSSSSTRLLLVGMYRISVFQIQRAGFMTTNPAEAGAGAGFQNLVQRKTTPELQ